MLAAKYSTFTCTPIVAGHYARPELPTTSDNEEKRDGYEPIKVNRCVIIVINNARPVYIYHSIPFPPSPPKKKEEGNKKQEKEKGIIVQPQAMTASPKKGCKRTTGESEGVEQVRSDRPALPLRLPVQTRKPPQRKRETESNRSNIKTLMKFAP